MNHVVKFFVFFCPAQKKDEFDGAMEQFIESPPER
jgi:hypothetical protein